MVRESEIRAGETAVEPPPARDAGLVFIGRIRTPWTSRLETPRQGRLDGPVCRLEIFEPWGPALQGLESALPSGHPGVGGQAMFDEVEPSSGVEYPSDLRQRRVGIRDRAQGERAQGAFAAVVWKWDRLTVEPHPFDGDERSCDALSRDPEGRRRRFHGEDPLDPRWVELDVETGAESDFQQVSRQTGRDLCPPCTQIGCSTRQVHDMGEDPVPVDRHCPRVARRAGLPPVLR